MRGVDHYSFGMRNKPIRVRPRVTVRRSERATSHNFERLFKPRAVQKITA